MRRKTTKACQHIYGGQHDIPLYAINLCKRTQVWIPLKSPTSHKRVVRDLFNDLNPKTPCLKFKMCLVPQSDLFFYFFYFFATATHTMEQNMRSRKKKSRIEIHFVSLGRNGKMEDHVLKWLSLLSKEQNTMRDPKSRVRGHFLAQLLSWCILFSESFIVSCSFWGTESHFRTCSATFCVSWSQRLVCLQRTKNSLLISSLYGVSYYVLTSC